MNLPKIKVPDSVYRAVSIAGLKLKYKSPDILLAAGIGAIVGGCVLACKETHDGLDEVMVSVTHNREKISLKENDDDYSDKDRRRDITKHYITAGLQFAKLYGPSATIIGLGITAIVGSHGMLNKRNAMLAGAYESVKTGFDIYRKRVVDELGDEADKRFRYGLIEDDVKENVKDKDGNEHTITTKKDTFDPTELSQWCRYYGPTTTPEFYINSPSLNLTTLKSREAYFNGLLHRRGFVFLNEVYDALGFPMIPEGQDIGWLDNGGDADTKYIDFGITEARNREAVNCCDPDGVNEYLLDFNVDGPIQNLI